MTEHRMLRRRLSRILTPSIQPHRLVLAFKTALAAGGGWVIGHLLPGVDDYSYYAPLGALIVMMPTLMSSLRSTMQTVLGLLLGILLAFGVMLSPLPGFVNVALAVGLGVLLGGLGGLGAGRDYVPIAALFVLVLGGSNADDFSLGYLVQMGAGMLVGVVVNALVLPPLWIRESSSSVSELRARMAEVLDEVSGRLAEGAELDGCLERVRELRVALREAEVLASDAAESRRLNPRSRRHPYDMDEDFDDLGALDRMSGQLRNLLEHVQEERPAPGEWNDAVAAVFGSLADLVRAWDSREETGPLQDARAAISHAEALGASAELLVGSRQLVRLVEDRVRPS